MNLTWTIMVITFTGGLFDGEVTLLPFRGTHACGQAIEAMYAQMAVAAPEVTVQCVPTGAPLVRPMPRPEGLGQ